MALQALPSQEALRQLLDYDPENGALFWKARGLEGFASHSTMQAWNSRRAGKRADSLRGPGYRYVRLGDLNVPAHRIILKMVNGIEPEEVDHINGDRADNRARNLRGVTRKENALNKRMRRDNSSGRVGVTSRSGGRYWVAEIQCGGVREYLGHFSTMAEAIGARAEAERRLGFHPNHGI